MKQATVEMVFSGFLAYQIETLLTMYEEHLIEWDGELIPNLWMADVAKAVVSGRIVGKELLVLLGILDRELHHGREGAQNIVAVSFVEHLPIPAAGGDRIIKGFKALEAQYRIVFGC